MFQRLASVDGIIMNRSNAFIMSHLCTRAILCEKFVTSYRFNGVLHRHVGSEIIYCQSGRGVLTAGNQTVPFNPGSLIYFDCQIPHSVMVEGDYRRWGLCFWLESLQGPLSNKALDAMVNSVRPSTNEVKLFRVPEQERRRLERHLEDLSEEVELQRSDFPIILQLHLYELHVLLRRLKYDTFQSLGSKGSSSFYERVGDVLSYIESNLSNDLSPEDVAGAFHYSTSHLNRLMKRATGQSFTEYVRSRRLERAKRLLIHTDLNVTAVAEAVGISNIAYFYRSFREESGVTPGNFRNRHEGLA